MGWVLISISITVLIVAGIWCSLLDEENFINTDESCDFWMTDED